MCAVTEKVIFTDPYTHSDMNKYTPGDSPWSLLNTCTLSCVYSLLRILSNISPLHNVFYSCSCPLICFPSTVPSFQYTSCLIYLLSITPFFPLFLSPVYLSSLASLFDILPLPLLNIQPLHTSGLESYAQGIKSDVELQLAAALLKEKFLGQTQVFFIPITPPLLTCILLSLHNQNPSILH